MFALFSTASRVGSRPFKDSDSFARWGSFFVHPLRAMLIFCRVTSVCRLPARISGFAATVRRYVSPLRLRPSDVSVVNQPGSCHFDDALSIPDVEGVEPLIHLRRHLGGQYEQTRELLFSEEGTRSLAVCLYVIDELCVRPIVHGDLVVGGRGIEPLFSEPQSDALTN